jgi:adenosine kinase
MNHSWKIKVPPADGISIGVVAPDSRQGMLEHAEQFKAAGIPFIFDPGQAMPLFEGEDFRRFISIADWLALNDYEWHLLQERTGWTAARLHEACEGVDHHARRRGLGDPCQWQGAPYSLRPGQRSGRPYGLRATPTAPA